MRVVTVAVAVLIACPSRWVRCRMLRRRCGLVRGFAEYLGRMLLKLAFLVDIDPDVISKLM